MKASRYLAHERAERKAGLGCRIFALNLLSGLLLSLNGLQGGRPLWSAQPSGAKVFWEPHLPSALWGSCQAGHTVCSQSGLSPYWEPSQSHKSGVETGCRTVEASVQLVSSSLKSGQ